MTAAIAISFAALALAAAAAAGQADMPADPLSRAALLGDAALVDELLAGGAAPNRQDESGRTALMWASCVLAHEGGEFPGSAPRDFEGVATLLLNQGAAIDLRDGSGRTALLLALEGAASEYKVIGADEAMARLLMSRGANVNAQDDVGWSPLLRVVAEWADQPKLLALLLARGADPTATLKDGRNAVMLAARLGKTDRLQPLLEAGVDPNAADVTGVTALTIAALAASEDTSLQMMRLLLAKGADPNRRDRGGRSSLDRAAEAGRLSRVEFLLAKGAIAPDRPAFLAKARNYALLHEISEGSADSARALLEQGADPNFRDGAGRTLLMLAAASDYSSEKAALLAQHGALIEERTADGETALMTAADDYQADTVKLLLAHGAGVNACDRLGNSVLLHAAASKRSWREDRYPLIGLLIDSGAEFNHRNAHGVTALMLLAADGNPGMQPLLAMGADVDARDEDGNTALLYAARHFVRGGQQNAGWALLEKGADANAANARGETALILAATQHEVEAARMLLAKGANVRAKTNQGRTALMQAIDAPKEFDNQNHVVYSPAIAQLLIDSGADVNARDSQGNSPLILAQARGYPEMATALQRAGAKQ